MATYKIAISPNKVVQKPTLVEARKYAMAHHPKKGWQVEIWTGKLDEDYGGLGNVEYINKKFWWVQIGKATMILPNGRLSQFTMAYMDLADY